MHIVGIVGSLRKDSFNKKLMHEVVNMLPAGTTFELLDISTLPLYNQDLESSFPSQAEELKEKIRGADGIIVATPEFNRTMPGALKNAFDWTSRPYGDSAWEGKKAMVIGASSGNISTALAQYDVKKVLNYLNAKFMGQPEVMIATVQDKFDETGALKDEKTKEFLAKTASAFAAFVAS